MPAALPASRASRKSAAGMPRAARTLTPALPAFVRPRGHAQAPAVLDHSRALAQGDGSVRPAFAGGAESGESKLVVLRAGDVLDDTFTVSGPGVDAESKVRSRCGHLQSSSASLFIAAQAGFLDFSRGLLRSSLWSSR